MTNGKDRIEAVPTTVITGFLGVGKTTTILDLVSRKPAHERWAVLINEFGEIGVDGSLVRGQASEESGVFVSEVPGGCMCCTSALPMQTALNQLLRKARPHRLLIEPTGLGHPAEVLSTLSSGHNKEVLSLGRTLTLVDARNLSDSRYTSHPTYLQQYEIADVVVANKADLYCPGDHEALAEFVQSHCRAGTGVLITEHGRLEVSALDGGLLSEADKSCTNEHTRAHDHSHSHSHDHTHTHDHAPTVLASDLPLPERGFLSATSGSNTVRSETGDGDAAETQPTLTSVGWRFSSALVFDRRKLTLLLEGIVAERMKAVFVTDEGIYGYNLSQNRISEVPLANCVESRIEIIAEEHAATLEKQLLACAS
ncbi:MAG: GTP-binding protein [Pseudomonadota bacterium]